MKGPIAAFIHGGGLLKRSGHPLRGCAYFVASIAEEMTEGATLARSFEGLDIDWCVIAEATALRLATAQRGRAKVAVAVTGESCHAAIRGGGPTPPTSPSISHVPSRPAPAGASPARPADINLIDIHSSRIRASPRSRTGAWRATSALFTWRDTRELLDAFRNVIPDGVQAEVGYHRALWTTYVGDSFEVDDYAAAWETPRESKLVRAAGAATGGELSDYQFCTNGSYFAGERGIHTVGYGGAARTRARRRREHPDRPLERAAEGYRDIALALLGE